MALLRAQQQTDAPEVWRFGELPIVGTRGEFGLGDPDILVRTGASSYLLVLDLIRRPATGSLRFTTIGDAESDEGQELPERTTVRGADDDEPSLVARQVAAIQVSLGAGVQDLAQMLRVSRPTVYAWLANAQQPQGHNLERLAQLESVANGIVSLAGRPLPRQALLASTGDIRLLDLLSSDPLVTEAIESHVTRLVESPVVREPRSILERLAAKRGETLSMPEDAAERVKDLTGTLAR